MEVPWSKKYCHFFQSERFVDKATSSFHSLNKIIDPGKMRLEWIRLDSVGTQKL